MASADVLRRGRRVHIRHPLASDRDAFLEAVRVSRRLHRPWTHPPSGTDAYLAFERSADVETTQRFLICRNDGGDLAGVANLSQIFHGAFRNAYLGFYAFSPHAGRGLMREGLGLTIRRAFTDLGLHRIQANVQPENERSIALLGSLGFTEEGYARRYLKIGGRWRDHVMFALLADDS
jgi:[ribosomal protein S5]-alanine N-acetyltransferase